MLWTRGKVSTMAVAATIPMQLEHTNPRNEVVLELVDEHFPLVLIRWGGQLQPQHLLRLMRFYDEVAQRAESEQTRVVHMIDARDATLPNSLIRDMLVDWLTDRTRDSSPGPTVILAPNPLIRGVVTSLKWATGRGSSIVLANRIEQAIASAVEAFESAGIPVPEVLQG